MSETTTKTMQCLTCSRILAWPDGFPNRASNRHCWRCFWLDHLAARHSRVVGRARRLAKRRARRMAARDLMAGAFGDDKTLIQLANGDLARPKFEEGEQR